MTEKRRAPESVMRDLCEALLADNRERSAYEAHTADDPTYNAVVHALRVYQHVTAPLRTRAEVDAEIAGIIRDWSGGSKGPFGSERFSSLLRLCSEPTTDEPDTAQWDDPQSYAYGAAQDDHRSAWRTGTKNPRVIYDGDDMIGSMDSPDLARRVVRSVTGHGSSSTPAAKESRDNAGVSAGPANALVDRVLASDEPEPEKCGCDESEGLRRELEKFRNELDATRIESAGRHRKLRDIQVEHDIWSTGKKTSATTLDAIGLILKGA